MDADKITEKIFKERHGDGFDLMGRVATAISDAYEAGCRVGMRAAIQDIMRINDAVHKEVVEQAAKVADGFARAASKHDQIVDPVSIARLIAEKIRKLGEQ